MPVGSAGFLHGCSKADASLPILCNGIRAAKATEIVQSSHLRSHGVWVGEVWEVKRHTCEVRDSCGWRPGGDMSPAPHDRARIGAAALQKQLLSLVGNWLSQLVSL